MYVYELNNLMFLVKSLKSPTDNFDIKNHRFYNYLPVINLSLPINVIKQQITNYLWT